MLRFPGPEPASIHDYGRRKPVESRTLLGVFKGTRTGYTVGCRSRTPVHRPLFRTPELITKEEKKRRKKEIMSFRFSQEDLNRSRLLEPALWYPCEIIKVHEDLMNMKNKGEVKRTNFDCQVIDGKCKGAIIYVNFNEAYPGFAIPFFAALSGKKVEQMSPDDSYDPKAAEGRKIKIFVTHRDYNGKMYNNAEAFKAIDAE